MDAGDWISLVSAIVAVLSLFGSMYFAWLASNAENRAQNQAERANAIAVGALETALREAIGKARSEVHSAFGAMQTMLGSRRKSDLDDAEKIAFEPLELMYRSAVENLLNAYEDACGKYVDNKIDKDRFKKMYISEIQKICDHSTESYAQLMHPESTSKLKAIWKVYHEWYTLEK